MIQSLELRMSCTVCSNAMDRLFQHEQHWICRCRGCGHRAAEIRETSDHVQRVYGDDYFEGGGAGYPGYLREAHILREHGRRYGRIMAGHRKPGTVLDVGAAAGFILQGLIDSGWTGKGIEPNARMAEHARSQLGLPVACSTLEGYQGDERFDLISMVQVLPMLVDPRRALSIAARLTAPGGYWLIETWNRDSLTARAFGSRWHEYSPPSVLHWFTVKSLRRMAAEFGFEEVGRGTPIKRIGAAHAKSLISYRLEGSQLRPIVDRLLQLMPDRVALPYPSEDLFYSVFRKR